MEENGASKKVLQKTVLSMRARYGSIPIGMENSIISSGFQYLRKNISPDDIPHPLVLYWKWFLTKAKIGLSEETTDNA